MDIYVLQDSQQTGPYSVSEIQARLSSGEFRNEDFWWREGMTDWQPLSTLSLSSTPPPPPVVLQQSQPTKTKTRGWVYAILGVVGCFVFISTLNELSESNSRSGISAEEALQQQKLRYRAAISKVMQETNSILNKYNNSPENLVLALRSVDTSNCPTDFRQSYLAFIYSVDDLLTYTKNNVPSGFWEVLFTGVWNLYTRGELDGGMTRMNEAVEQRRAAVDRSYKNLELVAQGY
jgi:hypothetical protein